MTEEEKIKAKLDLKKEIFGRLKELDNEILETKKEIFEHKKEVHLLKNELTSKMDFILA
jgi:peptidoglycan hydrolase CwlO-like protein